MDKKQTIQMMGLIRASYTKYYAVASEQEIDDIVMLWFTMLKEHDFLLVGQAVKAVIATNKFPPTVAEVIEKINDLKFGESMSELQAWAYISKAIRNSTYHAQEEWEKLPEQLRTIVTPYLLKSWAGMDGEDAETVLQSNFMRIFRAKTERQKQYTALPQSVKEYAITLADKMMLPGTDTNDTMHGQVP